MKTPVSQGPNPANGHETRDSGAPRIRLLIADDQLMDRKGMVSLLATQPDFEICGEAESGEEAVRMCAELRPQVLVLGVRMPGLDGIASIVAARQACPETRVLAVSDRGEQRCLVLNPPRFHRAQESEPAHEAPETGPACLATDCLELAVVQGAVGAIRRTASPEDLFRAVRAVASGNVWYDLGTASRMLQRSLGMGPGSEAQPLSERELEVASLIADGKSNKDISLMLKISEPTVKKHVGRLLEKLGLDDRLQIGLYIARNPLVLNRTPGPKR
ncbi:MAG: response regulator transcription factor [Candidatus Eisenbacteria bacterium]|nr:response regulator transcription factor [Candidatus Eisenbacteria bacterium]